MDITSSKPPGEGDKYCPECCGTGITYRQLNEDHRIEQTCAACGGTGSRAQALYNRISGQEADNRAKNTEQYVQRNWSFHHWTA